MHVMVMLIKLLNLFLWMQFRKYITLKTMLNLKMNLSKILTKTNKKELKI